MFEEAGPVRVGGNYGWRCREASRDFLPGNCGTAPASELINPTVEYNIPGSQSITGGYVYRGTAIPNLVGRYVFADFIGGNIWHIARDTPPTLDISNTTASAPMLDTPLAISSFAEGTDGELFVIDYSGTLHRIRQAP
jgi:hypothetical protein